MLNARKLAQLIERHESGQILESDIDAFLENPQLWRKPLQAEGSKFAVLSIDTAQAFWQGVYDELLGAGKVTVPAVPKLTTRQVKSLDRFGFLLVFVPALTLPAYPACFVKPDRQKYLGGAGDVMPLEGKWVAVETIAKPHYDATGGYLNDRLAAALKLTTRFNVSWDDLKGGLLERVAKVTHLPKKGTRLPTAEEWNFIANLFNWLRDHRSMNLPDLGSTRSVEWCENALGSEHRLIVGDVVLGGLAYVGDFWRELRRVSIAFRVLAVL